MIRDWMKMLLAILSGNLIYLLAARYLPYPLAHRIFQVDAGLLVDLGICVAIYLLVRKIF